MGVLFTPPLIRWFGRLRSSTSYIVDLDTFGRCWTLLDIREWFANARC